MHTGIKAVSEWVGAFKLHCSFLQPNPQHGSVALIDQVVANHQSF